MADTLRNIGRGLARGMTADVLGTPVDTLNQVRAGLLGPATAGNPYATAIRGLLGPEQQIGTGDWFAQQMGLPQGQGVAYEAARMLAPSPTEILSAVRRAPSIQKIANDDVEDIPEKEGYLRLYHGGRDSGFEQVPKGGKFDGFFASVGQVRGHGSGHNYVADIPEHKILTNYDLNYELPYKKVLDVFSKITKIKENDPEFESAWKAIIEETSDADELALSAGLADDYGEAGWVAQKMRGQVAKQLGYDAVEMQDEHGTSYLISPGVSLKYIGKAEK